MNAFSSPPRLGKCVWHMASSILARLLCLAVAIGCPVASLRAQTRASAPPLDSAETEQRITRLLGQMTLGEKVGQLVHFADNSTGPGAPHADAREQIVQGNVGSLENLTGGTETNALQKLAVEKTRLHIPLLFALDVIHGYRTVFPLPLAMASTWELILFRTRNDISQAGLYGIFGQ